MNPQRKLFPAAALALSLAAVAALPAAAASHAGGHGAHGAQGDAAKPALQTAAADLTEGEVRKVDKAAGKLTLKHGEIKNLDMPPMTMVFVLKDKALLDKLKTGDKVRFKAVNDAGTFTVTEMQSAQ